MGLRALARRLWPWTSNPAADIRQAGLRPLAPTAGLPLRPDRDRRPSVAVATLQGLRDDTAREIDLTLEFIELYFDDPAAYWQHQGRLSELRILLPKLDALIGIAAVERVKG